MYQILDGHLIDAHAVKKKEVPSTDKCEGHSYSYVGLQGPPFLLDS